MKKKIQYQIQPWISEMIDYFWSCKKSINSYKEDDFFDDCISGIPTKISNKLGDHIIDILCDNLYYLFRRNNTKKNFAKKIIKLISNGLIVVK
jgi:hypothetical protein